MKKRTLLSLISIFLFSVSGFSSDTEENLFAKHFNLQNGVAVHSFDVVSYFSGAPLVARQPLN